MNTCLYCKSVLICYSEAGMVEIPETGDAHQAVQQQAGHGGGFAINRVWVGYCEDALVCLCVLSCLWTSLHILCLSNLGVLCVALWKLLFFPSPPRNKHFLKRWEQLVHWCSSVFRKLKFTGLILYVLRDGRGWVGMEIHITANLVKTSETRNCGACDWENVEYNCEGTAVVMLCLYLTAVLIGCFYPKVSERAKYFAAKWMGMLPRSLAPCGAHSHWGFVAVWMVPKSCTEAFSCVFWTRWSHWAAVLWTPEPPQEVPLQQFIAQPHSCYLSNGFSGLTVKWVCYAVCCGTHYHYLNVSSFILLSRVTSFTCLAWWPGTTWA